MKKTFSIIISVIIAALFCAANAEVKTFTFSCVCDMEGKTIEESGSNLKGTTITIDDEAGTIKITGPENEEQGTIDIQEIKGGRAIYATMESGEELVYAYSTSNDGIEMLSTVNSDNTCCYLFALE